MKCIIIYYHLTYKTKANYSRQKTKHSFREQEHSFRCTTRVYSRPWYCIGMVFLIYVNYSSTHLTCNTELYADNTTLHESAKCLSTIQESLQTNLLKVQTWFNTNKAIINPENTTCMVVGSSRKLKQSCSMLLSISGNKISRFVYVQPQKLLGLYIDNTLSRKPHIDSVCAKMSSRIFLLKKSNLT